MSGPQLVIGNKNYSSWSMRAWVLLRALGIDFEEVQLKLHTEAWDREIGRLSPSGRVPVLWLDGAPVWDTLAIAETVAERWPDRQAWPRDARARAVARAACAEMHSGFHALREAMPMNIRGAYPGRGMGPGVAQDIDRIVAIWTMCRERHGRDGALLFGAFTAADAFYAPVATRFVTYGVRLPDAARRYVDAVLALPAVQTWSAAARAEPEVIAAEEPYADHAR
ncbi:MAG: glutathione S-transferase family protein [Burkholderiales bacterium]